MNTCYAPTPTPTPAPEPESFCPSASLSQASSLLSRGVLRCPISWCPLMTMTIAADYSPSRNPRSGLVVLLLLSRYLLRCRVLWMHSCLCYSRIRILCCGQMGGSCVQVWLIHWSCHWVSFYWMCGWVVRVWSLWMMTQKAVFDCHFSEWRSHLRVPTHLWRLDWLRPEDLVAMQKASRVLVL
jgi:hypothetical protein